MIENPVQSPMEERIFMKHPLILPLFVRLNTTIPSSAPVERLFSQATLVLTARRNRLCDEILEQLILPKIELDCA